MARVALKDGLFTMGIEPDGSRLLGGRCPECGRHNFPAQSLCPYCCGDHCEAVPLSPTGRVEVCTTVINRPPGYDGPMPFGFGVVELPEGLRIISRISQPDRIQAGTPVRLVLDPLGTDTNGREVVTYAFAPVES